MSRHRHAIQNERRKAVERMGRWIDFDNGYRTRNTPFMESFWWVFKTMFEKNLVYRGLRVMPYSSGCTTPLSNFEAGLDYRDVQDPAGTVSFPLLDDPEISLLAWTTTPWTLPSNLGLCVHPHFTYIKIHDEERNQNFIILEKLLTTLYKDPKKAKFKKISTIKGSDMAGWKFKPIFPYFYDQYKDTAFRVVVDKYVTDSSGTGIVHQAPAFGEDDHRIAVANNIITRESAPPCPLDDASRFTSDVPEYQGQFIKDADKNIIKHLKAAGRLIVQSQLMHSYPFCWRSKQPLIYTAIPACQQGKGVLRRVEEIFDCWLESGSMPYVQAHYPFENKEEFEKSFPANFLSGGIDQTRGWFYTLLIGRDAPVRQGALEERHLLWSRTSS
ncbi:unnamed protein product [Tilletia caries]|nr:unnamed protein product [Tilletia caries]